MDRSASSVLVCRGCCCGTTRKAPEVDHEAQVSQLRSAALAVGARFHVVDCLGPCERANVVVVRDGDRRFWLGEIGDDETTQLAGWLGAVSDAVPGSLDAHVFDGPSGRARRRLLPERGRDLAELCAGLCVNGGTWTMGIPGAIAEFDASTEAPAVHTEGRGDAIELSAIGSTGAMRVRFDASTRAFAFGSKAAPEEPEAHLVVRTGNGLTPRHGLTEIGPDPHPILEASPNAVLFDIGLDRQAASFLVRVDDVELTSLLRTAVGTPLEALDESVWQALVEVSPTRVVETAAGRVEVAAPIPPPGGESPIGSHTHLLPDVLEVGLDLPNGMTIPPGWQPGPVHYPARTDQEDRQ